MWKSSKKYFFLFGEEAATNPVYKGYVGGHVKIYEANAGECAKEEIRFLPINYLSSIRYGTSGTLRKWVWGN